MAGTRTIPLNFPFLEVKKKRFYLCQQIPGLESRIDAVRPGLPGTITARSKEPPMSTA